MPCTALARGTRQTPPHTSLLPFNDAINNSPCGKPSVIAVAGVNVAAESLCVNHWIFKHGYGDWVGPFVVEDGSAVLAPPSPLVLTGGVITDAVRAAGIEGDALGQTDAYTVTNRVLNGGFETNVSGWAGRGGAASPTRVTSQQKFGAASAEIVSTLLSQGIQSSTLPLVTPNTPVTMSAWAMSPAGGQAQLGFANYTAQGGQEGVYGQGAIVTLPAGVWTLLSYTRTTAGDTNAVLLTIGTTGVATYIDGVQVETGSVAHAYVETNGATASQTYPATFAGDSSMGVWEATTNLFPNGGFETNTTGCVLWGNATISRVTSERKFGTASLKAATTTGGASPAGVQLNASGLTAAQTYTLSAWVKGPAGEQGKFWIDGAYNVSWTFSGGWERKTLVFVASSASFPIYVQRNLLTGNPFDFYLDGVQIEAKAFATPYVHTDGATATRATGVVKAPVLFTANQGWILVRFRPGKPVAQMDYDRYWGWWSGSLSAYLTGKFLGGQFGFDRAPTGSGALQGVSLSPGTPASIICAWTPTAAKLSGNGASFASGVSGAIPVPSQTEVYIGSFPFEGLTEMCGEVLSVAMGDGDLSNADAAAMHTWLNANDDAILVDRTSLHPSCKGFYDMRTLVGK